jgi:competence ComEA-like helix-hairpin-helix protein
MNPRSNDRWAGLLILFLILLVVQPLRSALRLPRPHKSPCAEPFFVEIRGDDIRYPGIYPVCDRSGLQSLPAIAGGQGTPFEFRAELLNRLDLAKGPKVTVRRETGRYSFVLGEIQAHRRITLGIPLALNEASEVELTAIPGVGPGIAGAIARERTIRGRFERLDELRRVRGIGPRLYERMKRYLIL